MNYLIYRNDGSFSAEVPALPLDEVHIWYASVSQEINTRRIKPLEHLLSHDERQRAERFIFQKDYNQYVSARGLLRVLLSRYTGQNPRELVFAYNPYGKPELDDFSGIEKIYFNLSHSGEIVLFAITRMREVGIDVEQIRPFEYADQIVERYFSDKEKAQFRLLHEDTKIEAFFTCWTRKEAYIKALGRGLSIPLNQFSISFLPGEPARIIDRHTSLSHEVQWTLEDVSPRKGYVAAAAVGGAGMKFVNMQWL